MSYIPNKSDLQYKGEFDASANSPLLSDSNGETGDLYRVTISGVTDFGSGPIELKENDYILFNTNEQWEKFISQNIVKGGKKPIIQLTSTDNDTNINNDTITVISWDNTLIKDNGYVHDTSSNNGQVTINESGRYLVYVSLAYNSNGNARINPRIRFRLNGNILEGEGLTGYVRNRSGHNEGSNNLSRIIDFNAGDTLEVITDRIANDGTVTLRPNESIFFIQKFQSVVYQTQQIDADTLGGLESTEFAKNGENLILNSRKVTSDYSITNNDYGIYADASNGPITITVPDAESFNGYIFSITKTDNSTNQVFIETISENFTINGNFLMSLKDQFDSATIQSDGNNYYIPYKDDKTSSVEFTILADKTNPDQYDAVTFSVDSNFDKIQYYWDFGDGTTSTEQNPVHVYGGEAGSTYTVTLIAKDSQNLGGLAVKEDFIEVQNDSYLGDKVTALEFIISLYKLTAQATKAIRIRESNNNNETDIGFESNSPNAKVDVNAINAFLSNNNADTPYIVQFYDQLDNNAILEESDASKQATISTSRVGVYFVGGNRTESYHWLKTITLPEENSGDVFQVYFQGFKPEGGGSANRHNTSNSYIYDSSIRGGHFSIDFNTCNFSNYPIIYASYSGEIYGYQPMITGYGLNLSDLNQSNLDFNCFAMFNSRIAYQRGYGGRWHKTRAGSTLTRYFYNHGQGGSVMRMTSAICLNGLYNSHDKHRIKQNLNNIGGTNY